MWFAIDFTSEGTRKLPDVAAKKEALEQDLCVGLRRSNHNIKAGTRSGRDLLACFFLLLAWLKR